MGGVGRDGFVGGVVWVADRVAESDLATVGEEKILDRSWFWIGIGARCW